MYYEDDVRLYVIVRSDLVSMTPGKAAAQATHAANQCVWEIANSPTRTNYHTRTLLLKAWEGDRSFGTCIVLAAPIAELTKIIIQCSQHGIHSGIIHDPSYPLRDGDFTHLIPLDTCGYVFGTKEEAEPFLNRLPLL
jgi:peptidyl-tRNA hydrolase